MKLSHSIAAIFAMALLTGPVLRAQEPALSDFFPVSMKPFYYGVASGDPTPSSVIIWTQVTPDIAGPVSVYWQVSTSPMMADAVAYGTVTTDADRDYTVKVDVQGLDADTTYYYHFYALNAYSITGRTKTAPQGDVDSLKFAVISCSAFEWGYFAGYHYLSQRNDLDAIIHLGDYFYEYGDNASYSSPAIRDDRVQFPAHECVTLDDYRQRYRTYRLDQNLRRAHQQHPFIAVWDDHESANDAWVEGAENHDPETEGDWETRKAESKQAYFEWMPIRENPDGSIYRKLSFGQMADLLMLDTRLEGREEQIADVTNPALYAPERTMLGTAQKQWFLGELAASQARWKVIGNQVIFSEFNVGWAGPAIGQTPEQTESLFLDIWDGYPAERLEIIGTIDGGGIENVVFVTGDFHSTFSFEVAADPDNPASGYNPATGEGAVALEFAVPSVSAANFDENLDVPTAFGLELQINQPIAELQGYNPNPHMKFVDLDRHGYMILTLTEDNAQADYYYLDDVRSIDSAESWGGGVNAAAGTNLLLPNAAEAAPKAVQATPAHEYIAVPFGTPVYTSNYYFSFPYGWFFTDPALFPWFWNELNHLWMQFYKVATGGRAFYIPSQDRFIEPTE